MDSLDRSIINRLQTGLPLCERPFLELAEELDTSEETLLERLQTMLDSGLLTRFGPLFVADHLGGVLSLCAICVPEDQFERVESIVNSFDEVAHNYERDHELNMWFVIACDALSTKQRVLGDIERQTGLEVLDMPKSREFFIGLHLEV